MLGATDQKNPQPAPNRREFVIGRTGTGADIEVDDPRVRRDHARFTIDGSGRWHLRAASGRLFVGGVRARAAVLSVGGSFVVGQTSVKVSSALLAGRTADAVLTSAGRGLPVELNAVSVFRSGRALLDNVSMRAEPGEFVAIVGPSGAGKSSLMKVMLGECRPDQGTATVGDNRVGAGLDGRLVRDQIRYVPQSDSDDLYRSLRVRETLAIAARLRANADTPRTDLDRRVDSALDWLGLRSQSGDLVRTLSGGQRRRVSIGVEIVGHPQLLLLDEPTSGLDPGKDRDIMRRLRQLSRDIHCTVIVTTHSTSHLTEVDRVIVLARGGQIRYSGPADGALDASGEISWADWLVSLDSEPPRPVVSASTARPVSLTSSPSGPPFVGFATVLARQLTLVRRRGAGSLLALLLMPLVGTAIAAVASDRGLRGVQATQALAILATAAALTGAALSYQDLVNERAVLRRDWRIGVTGPTLLWSKAAVYAIVCAVMAAMMTGAYASVRALPDQSFGLPPAQAIFLALFGIMLASMGLGMVISAGSGSPERAVTWNTLLAVVQVALAGALFKLPLPLHLLSPLLPARLGLAAMASYAAVNDARRASGLYADPLWQPTGVYFWVLLVAILVLFNCSTLVAIRISEREWRRGADNGRSTGP